MNGILTAVMLLIFVGEGVGAQPNRAAKSESVQIDIINTEKKKVGTATFRETPNGMLLRVELRPNAPGISAGPHAIHIHESGECEPLFKSAGSHFNAMGKKHGFLDKEGAHLGDLPNIHVSENGALTVEFLDAGISLNGGDGNLLDADGSALVIHAGADDYRTDPAAMPEIGSHAGLSDASPASRPKASKAQ